MLFTISKMFDFSSTSAKPDGNRKPEEIVGKTTFISKGYDLSTHEISISFVVNKPFRLHDGQLMAQYLNYPEDSLEHANAEFELTRRGYNLKK